MTRDQAETIIQQLLGDESYERFFAEIFGREMLYLPAGENGFRDTFGDDPRSTILKHFASHAKGMTCHTARPRGPVPEIGELQSAEEFGELIRRYNANGYTARIPNAIAFSEELANIGRALELLLLKPVDAVIFWSGPDATAPVHHDEYDVLAIQLVGTKRWFISGEEPALTNPWKRIGELPPALNDPRQLDMRPGDLLYLPRGTPHTVTAGEETIHISIGLTPTTLRDALVGLVDYASDGERTLREGATDRLDQPLGPDQMAGLRERLQQALALVASYAQTDNAVSAAMHYRAGRMVNELPRLKQASAQLSLTADTRLRHAAGAIAIVSDTPNGWNFAQPAEHLMVNHPVEDSLAFIRDTGEFRVGDIPSRFGDDIRIALATRFVQSGFLELV